MIKTGFIYVFYSIYVLIGNFIVGLEIFPGLFHRGSSDLEWYFFENGLALVIIVTTILAFFMYAMGYI